MRNKTVLITGVSGYLGEKLVLELHHKYDWSLVGLDIKPPSDKTLECLDIFFQQDIRAELETIFEKYAITAVIHLAWSVKPTHNVTEARSIDIEGTMNILRSAEKFKCEYFLHTSSTLAYGAHPDNDIPLTEKSLLRGNKDFHYPHHKAQVEQKIHDFLNNQNTHLKLGIIRPTSFIGPDLDNYITRILQGSWRTFFLLPYPDDDTTIQWTHINDIIQAYRIMIEQQLEGPYNAGTDSWVKMKDIPSILNKEKWAFQLPYGLLKLLLKIQWFLRISEAPPGYLDFVKYSFVASVDKLKQKGFKPKYSSEEALRTLVN